jgi:uncharacterized membrane protein (GlpM family)
VTSQPARLRTIILALLIDAVIVVVFVLTGRRTHQQATDIAATLGALWPFLAALGAGWLISKAHRAPTHPGRGVIIWAVTIVVGMALRAGVMGQGTATAFVLVAAGFTAAGIIGWRLLFSLIAARTARY